MIGLFLEKASENLVESVASGASTEAQSKGPKAPPTAPEGALPE
jgi:hypothetical protein